MLLYFISPESKNSDIANFEKLTDTAFYIRLFTPTNSLTFPSQTDCIPSK
ncbi:MAG: hypothetical protein ACI81T_003646 [Bacteroidia bacterium]|jgi:hypothetical protein